LRPNQFEDLNKTRNKIEFSDLTAMDHYLYKDYVGVSTV